MCADVVIDPLHLAAKDRLDGEHHPIAINRKSSLLRHTGWSRIRTCTTKTTLGLSPYEFLKISKLVACGSQRYAFGNREYAFTFPPSIPKEFHCVATGAIFEKSWQSLQNYFRRMRFKQRCSVLNLADVATSPATTNGAIAIFLTLQLFVKLPSKGLVRDHDFVR